MQVYAFAQHMQALAMVAGGSVTVLSHPSLQGINSGTGLSGSNAWHGAFRFRQYLSGVKSENSEPVDSDLRELEFKKNQYGPLGEKIVLRYQRGLFLPVPSASTLEKTASEAKADQTFRELLRRFSAQGRNVSHNVKSTSNYAPWVFAQETTAFSKSDFERAMRRLFTANKIRVENYGRPSQPCTKIVEVE